MDEWACRLTPPHDFVWVPHLRPESHHRIAAHTFRSPVAVICGRGLFVALVPDISDSSTRPWIHQGVLDLAVSNDVTKLGYGLEPTVPTGHVLFRTDSDSHVQPINDRIRLSYDILVGPADHRLDCLRLVNAFLWSRHAAPNIKLVSPDVAAPDRLASVAYDTLFAQGQFETFQIRSSECGGFRAEHEHAEYFKRPDPIVWNQTWFNGQRSAYGLAHFGQKSGMKEWCRAASRITGTTLESPNWGGLFPAIYAFADQEWWGSVPRLNGGKDRIHVSDAASTASWLLQYARDIDPVPEIAQRCNELGDVLVSRQDADGSIPAWFDWDGAVLTPVPELERSAETGAAAMYLAELALEISGERFRGPAQRAADFLANEVMLTGAYQDYETFYSCCPNVPGFRDPQTGILPQNSLAIFWTASTMLGVYRLTEDERYLNLAREAVDLLSLFQQVWNPPFLSLEAFGGFGVMNTDAEWSDARQSLFAPLYFDLHRVTGDQEYLERGRAALRASFVLACLPEHASLNPKGNSLHPLGIMPENYGHGGTDEPSGRSDTCWGECGALTTAAFLERRFPDIAPTLTA
jgi:hypothetical protein